MRSYSSTRALELKKSSKSERPTRHHEQTIRKANAASKRDLIQLASTRLCQLTAFRLQRFLATVSAVQFARAATRVGTFHSSFSPRSAISFS